MWGLKPTNICSSLQSRVKLNNSNLFSSESMNMMMMMVRRNSGYRGIQTKRNFMNFTASFNNNNNERTTTCILRGKNSCEKKEQNTNGFHTCQRLIDNTTTRNNNNNNNNNRKMWQILFPSSTLTAKPKIFARNVGGQQIEIRKKQRFYIDSMGFVMHGVPPKLAFGSLKEWARFVKLKILNAFKKTYSLSTLIVIHQSHDLLLCNIIIHHLPPLHHHHPYHHDAFHYYYYYALIIIMHHLVLLLLLLLLLCTYYYYALIIIMHNLLLLLLLLLLLCTYYYYAQLFIIIIIIIMRIRRNMQSLKD
jgi:hypothetical protein